MTDHPAKRLTHAFLFDTATLREAVRMFQKENTPVLAVIDENYFVEGILKASTVLSYLEENRDLNLPLPASWIEPSPVLSSDFSAEDYPDREAAVPVTEDGIFLGLVTSQAVVQELKESSVSSRQNAEILDVIFETAYEGIAVVDELSRITKMNKAYRNFLGIPEDEIVEGRPVTEVIENTRLHVTVETGSPERGKTQMIQGQKMIVHRIPIWRGDKVAGAIGMLIFEGVSELYHILENAGRTLPPLSAAPDVPMPTEEESRQVTFEKMIGTSSALQQAKSRARKAARTKATVMITGESGTGKEVFAQAIRSMSPRADEPFVSINCAAIPEQLLEAELFGYEEGAFTGARKGGQAGKFEAAHKGTIFLDEIGDMPLHMQTKILRVLEEEAVVRVGGHKVIPLDVRVITATNQNLLEKVAAGTFRKDLYYRLNVIHLELPRLKERKEDIPSLIEHYVPLLTEKHQLPEKAFEKEAVAALRNYSWPGNVRELVNLLEQVLTLTDNQTIRFKDLPAVVTGSTASDSDSSFLSQERGKSEKEIIEQALLEAGHNKTSAAKKLGIHRTTLYKKMKELHIT
ncbi:sigma 54-interacting transcriptional regulator [Alkalicoccus saliphilus]|uniref:Sigma-54-dependent Fis family transcriptional regulator n=1 Tax=Alkalicoccus saliphilus TaxID=200989 RepID=A0A2T4U1U8_9BACI|nr:sigma 54-interacting transcriptional regulator [Alkalicoccus saliphilus]PTL37370.1 sigma-54-dependent Fis family transcriptional regulator [Alkalicoccus saliphilus]